VSDLLNFDDLVAEPDTRYDTVKTPRGSVRLGSVSSADILEWMDDNEDKVRGVFSGLRLLVKTIVNADGKRIGDGLPDAERLKAQAEALERLKKRDSVENGKLVQACLVLNGLRAKAIVPPNDASGAASPTAASLSE
jgi:hypothetical protein